MNALEQAVTTTRDWCADLRERATALSAEPPSPAIADAAFDLGAALEAAEPDRHQAIEMYLLSARAAPGPGPDGALARARRLCLELGEMQTAARIARMEYQRTTDPAFLVAEGGIWLDAGQPDHALAALAMAATELPSDPAVKAALAAARGDLEPDAVKAELTRLEAEAASANSPAISSERVLAGARLIRTTFTGDADLYVRLVRRAYEIDPLNDTALALLEDHLIERNDRQGLTKCYEQRAAVSPHQAIDALRRAGTKLVLGRKNPGLGIQLIAAGLDRAYRNRIGPIQGHLAMLVLLRRFSESARVERDLLTMLARGLEMELPPVEEVGLAAVGLDTAWGRLRDADLAYPYAAVLARRAERHPALAAYYAEGGMAAGHKRATELGDGSIDVDFDDLDDGAIEELELEPEEASASRPVPASSPSIPAAASSPSIRVTPSSPSILPPAPPRPADVSARPGAAALAVALPTSPAPMPVKPLSAATGLVPQAALSAIKGSRSRPEAVAPLEPPAAEARRAERIRIAADVQLTVLASAGQAEHRLAAVTRDVSETGLFLVTSEPLRVGDRVKLTIDISSVDDWEINAFSLSGRVVRAVDGGYGVDLDERPRDWLAKIGSLSANRGSTTS